MKPLLSVVLPTHNPRPVALSRTIEALRGQTLSPGTWELLVVDNRSSPPVAGGLDLAWHPRARVIREEILGLTPARLCGFLHAGADLLVLVDDDNVLAPDYLETALRIAGTHPCLGVFGGSLEPEFEAPPPEWTRPHWEMIAVRPATRTVWSNDIEHYEATPAGAGMCLRRQVASRYREEMDLYPLRRALDRTGNNLSSGGDTDMVFTCLAMGLGMGRFKDLRLRHLIPPGRLTAEYLERLHEAIGYSEQLLNALWNRSGSGSSGRGLAALLKLGVRALLRDLGQRRFLRARRRGAARASGVLARLAEAGPGRDSAGSTAPAART